MGHLALYVLVFGSAHHVLKKKLLVLVVVSGYFCPLWFLSILFCVL